MHQWDTWKEGLKQRAGARWALKMLVTTLGIAAFFYAYFWVMRHAWSPVTVMPLIWLDRVIGFWPPSFLLYVSLWVYVALGSALLRDARELAAWGAASFAMIVVGLGVFLALPTRIPDPGIDWFRYPSLHFLKTVDVSGNACPSLHAAFAAFNAIVLHRTLTEIRAPRPLLAFNLLWGLGIVYSTVATRQHVALDVLAGILLAAVASVAYLRWLADGERRPGFATDQGLPLETPK